MGGVSRAIGGAIRYIGDKTGVAFAKLVDRTFGTNLQSPFRGGTELLAGVFDPQPPEYNYKKLRVDLEITGSSEGDEVPLVMGQNVKVAGALIWVGKVKKKVVKSEGGKGGADFSDPKTKTLVDCMFMISENELQATANMREVAGNGLTIWRRDDDLTYDFDDFTVTAGSFSGGLPKLEITSPQFGVDLSRFYTGKDVVLSGGFNLANREVGGQPIQWRVIKAQFAKKTGISKLVLKDVSDTASPVSEATPSGAVITQTLPDIQKAMQDGALLTGSSSQTAPSIYTTFEELPVDYKRRGTFWMQQLNILKVGGIQNLEFWVDERNTDLTLSEAVDIIMNYRTELDSSEWDSTQLTGTVRGYKAEPGSAQDALEPLMAAFDFTYRTNGSGQVVFFHRATGVVNTSLAEDELAAQIGNSEGSDRPGELTVRSGQDFPYKCTVSFLDVGNELQRGTVEEVRFGTETGHEITVDLGTLALTREEARQIAQRELYAVEAREMTLRTSLLPKYLSQRVDDTMDVTMNGTVYPMRIGAIEETDNWLLTLDMHTHINGVPYTAPNEDTIGTKDGITNELDVHAFVAAPLFSDEEQKPGFYFACSRTDETDDWNGAVLYKGVPDGAGGTEYVAVEEIEDEGVVGYFIEAESTWWETNDSNVNFIPFMWDDYHEIVVQLVNEDQTLTSRTDAEVLAGANRMMWGNNEYIAFANVEDLGSGKYKLTRIIRGFRNTTWTAVGPDGTDAHPDGQRCIITTEAGLNFRAETINEINKNTSYKLVPADQDPDDVAPFTVDLSPDQFQGGAFFTNSNLSPMSPAWVTTVDNDTEEEYFPNADFFDNGGGGEDKTVGIGCGEPIRLTVTRRTRALINAFRSQSVPVSEETPQFEFRIMGDGGATFDGAQGTEVAQASSRTLITDPTAADPYSVVYTTAMQIEDNWGASTNGTSQEAVSEGRLFIMVFQLSATTGRGPPLFVVSQNGKVDVVKWPLTPFVPT